MTEAASKTSPFVIAASIAVIVFSIVGVAALTGLLPSRTSAPEATATAPAEQIAEAPAMPAAAAPPPEKPAAVEQPAALPPAAQPKPVRKAEAERKQVKPSRSSEALKVQSPAQPPICADCGVIVAIKAVEQAGGGTGLGAVAGGVVGGLLGHQIGGGGGKDVATIAGAVGGGYAGHQIEKKVKTTKHYEIIVRMDDGSQRTFTQDDEPGLMVGDKVKIVDGALIRN